MRAGLIAVAIVSGLLYGGYIFAVAFVAVACLALICDDVHRLVLLHSNPSDAKAAPDIPDASESDPRPHH
jgi:hypothetical protein